MAHGSVLLVDDEPKIRQALSQALLDDVFFEASTWVTGPRRESARVPTPV